MSRDHYYEELNDLRDEERKLFFVSTRSNSGTNYYANRRLYYVQDRIDNVIESHKTNYERQQDYYRATIEANEEKTKEQKERKDNIPKRAQMLETASDDIVTLSQLPYVLCKEIAEYEGGVESSLLGEEQTNNNSFWSWCSVL